MKNCCMTWNNREYANLVLNLHVYLINVASQLLSSLRMLL